MFVRRLIDHLLNQVLVEGLANSRWFQRFAVWSHNAMKEVQSKSKDGSATLDTHVSSFVDMAKQKSAQLRQDFQQELRKVQEQQQQMKR